MKPSHSPRRPSRRSFLGGLFLAAGGSLAGAARAAGAVDRSLAPDTGKLPKLPTVDEWLRSAADRAPLELLFHGSTPADLQAWQKRFSSELQKRLRGPHRSPQQWTIAPLSTRSLDDYTREEWLLTADGVPSLPLYVLRPGVGKFGSGPHPIVLCLHGHGPFGYDSVAGVDDTPERMEDIRQFNYDYGRKLAQQGYLAVAPCLLPFGRRLDESYRRSEQDPCAGTFNRLMLLGQTLIGSNLRDVQWALDYACTRSDARPDRIGCVGLSYGGRMTMLAAALDSRIRVAVISGALNLMQERIRGHYSCGAQVIPGLLEIGDTPEIGSLIAPRPCIWEWGTEDSLIDPAWAEQMIVRLRRAYAAAGKPDHLSIHRFTGAHRWDGATAWPLLREQLMR